MCSKRLILRAVAAIISAGLLYAQNASSPAGRKLVLDKYCLACHNKKLRMAGLALENLDAAKPGAHAEVWEKVIAKLRAGSMPPAGSPRRMPPATVLSRAGWNARSTVRGQPIRIRAASAPFTG
jgi:cytochrome c551/c552